MYSLDDVRLYDSMSHLNRAKPSFLPVAAESNMELDDVNNRRSVFRPVVNINFKTLEVLKNEAPVWHSDNRTAKVTRVLEVELCLQKEHPPGHAGLVGRNNVPHRTAFDPSDLATDAKSSILIRIPVKAATDFVRIPELAKHT